MPVLEVNGVCFHYIDVGKGVPLLLLGGTLGSAEIDFGPQIEAFRHDWRVIAPDRRGYGKTRPPTRDFPDDFYQREAKDMAALAAALKLPPAIVLGWSEGADVALCLAAMFPEQVCRVIVWGGVVRADSEDIALFEARRDVSQWPQKARAGFDALYGPAYWEKAWNDWCDVMGRLHAAGGDVRLAALDRIDCPVTILHGSKDPLIRLAHPTELHRRIPHSSLQFIEGAGHNPQLTHSEEFNRFVRGLIQAPTYS